MKRVSRALFALIMLAGFHSATAQTQPESLLATLTVNGIALPRIVPVLREDGQMLLRITDLDWLGFVMPEAPVTSYREQPFVPIDTIPGLSYELDERRLDLAVTCRASCFRPNIIGHPWQFTSPSPTEAGAFLNYDVVAEEVANEDAANALAELGVFTEAGLGLFEFIGQDLSERSEFVRLDTSWTVDDPQTRESFRVGDGITRPGGWGLPVRFAGVHFGTDFALQPGFVTFPLPSVRGEAALPSTVDVFVNDVRRVQTTIRPGPFTLPEAPVVAGAGEVEVVVTDLLGREQRISETFYASPGLLKSGLEEYSVEAGIGRRNFGVESNRYDELLATGSYRLGLTDTLTAGFHAEFSDERTALGPNLDLQPPFGGTFSISMAGSLKDSDKGGLTRIGYEWLSPRWSAAVVSQIASPRFARLGELGTEPFTRHETSASVGINLDTLGSVSFNYTLRDERSGGDFEAVSASYSLSFGEVGTLGLSALRVLEEEPSSALMLMFTTTFGPGIVGTAAARAGSAEHSQTIRFWNHIPPEGGWGYRVQAGRGDDQRKEAGLTYDSPSGVVSADVSRVQKETSTRVQAQGGMILMDWNPYLARPVDSAFALVEADDFEGVGVLRENQRVTETDSSGLALVTGLRDFDENRIAIDPLDLPLDAELGATVVTVVPRRRSGVYIDFDVRRMRAALVTVVNEDGEPLPPGTRLRTPDGAETFPVGLAGRAYPSGLEQALRLEAQTAEGPCEVELPAIGPELFGRDLGTFVCKRVAP